MVGSAQKNGEATRTRKTRHERQGVVPVSHCAPFLRVLHERGLQPERARRLLGICSPEQNPATQFISEMSFRSFLRLVEELSADPCIGLYAGAAIAASEMSAFDLVIRTQTYGEIAPHRYTQGRVRTSNALTLEVSLADGAIVCRRARPTLPASRLLSDYLLAAIVTCTRHIYGAIAPIAVHLTRAKPEDTRAYQPVLGECLCFGQPQDAVLLPLDLLALPSLYQGETIVELILALAQATLVAPDAAPRSVYASSLIGCLHAR